MKLRDLLSSAPVLADGAWGTELQSRGLAVGDCPDHWNLLRPEAVAEVARAYVEAGSRVILTNTFRANRVALSGYGLEDQTFAINRAGAAISRQAAGRAARVFASIGPTGKMLAAGEVTPERVTLAFEEQAAALAEGGADALLIETMSDLEEAAIALAAARKTGLPVVVSFTFDTGKNKDRTMTGVRPEQAAERMAEKGADVVGANCGIGVAEYVPICRRLRAATDLPLWIKANAGLPEMEDGRPVYRTTAEQFASHLPALIEAGASFIGGCCGTGPGFIRAARDRLYAEVKP
jgi:5-methyltetrahydrofolate--homocysteine methyltransferase